MDYLAPRIIAFGCSFTNYLYPTYADILNAENRGHTGSGNERIFYEVMSAYKKGEFDNFDVIIVQWSSFFRFDYKTAKGWTEPDGSIMHSKSNSDIWESIKLWYNEDYEIEKNVNYVIALWSILSNLNKKIIFLSMHIIPDTGVPFLYKELFEHFKGNYKFSKNVHWINKSFVDQHPTVLQHTVIALGIAKELGFNLDPIRVGAARKIHEEILSDENFVHRTITC